MIFQFDSEIAKKYGVNEAIFIWNLYRWLDYNKKNNLKQASRDGRIWSFQTCKEIAKDFEFFSVKQVRTITAKLEELGLVIVGNYNKLGQDRTKWYTLNNDVLLYFNKDFYNDIDSNFINNCHLPKWANGAELSTNPQNQLPKRANANAQMGEPLQDIINNTDVINNYNNLTRACEYGSSKQITANENKQIEFWTNELARKIDDLKFFKEELTRVFKTDSLVDTVFDTLAKFIVKENDFVLKGETHKYSYVVELIKNMRFSLFNKIIFALTEKDPPRIKQISDYRNYILKIVVANDPQKLYAKEGE